jgi:hypothetical protein
VNQKPESKSSEQNNDVGTALLFIVFVTPCSWVSARELLYVDCTVTMSWRLPARIYLYWYKYILLAYCTRTYCNTVFVRESEIFLVAEFFTHDRAKPKIHKRSSNDLRSKLSYFLERDSLLSLLLHLIIFIIMKVAFAFFLYLVIVGGTLVGASEVASAKKPNELQAALGSMAPNATLGLRTDIPGFDRFIINVEARATVLAQVKNAINGEDYECATTGLDNYTSSLIQGLNSAELELLWTLFNDLSVDAWLFFSLILFKVESQTDPGRFYPGFQQGKEYYKCLINMERFWDAFSDDIGLYAFSTAMLSNTEMMIETILFIFDFPPSINNAAELALEYVTMVQGIFDAFPSIGYDFPLWTLNAFAYKLDEMFGGNGIAMGDGLVRIWENTIFFLDIELRFPPNPRCYYSSLTLLFIGSILGV